MPTTPDAIVTAQPPTPGGLGAGAPLRTATRPYPGLRDPSQGDLKREYVAGGGWPWYGRIARTLPWAIDDLTNDFGDDIYQRMLHDPQVAACAAIFKAGILEHGGQIKAAIDDDEDQQFDLAAEIADEADDMLSDLDTPLDDVLWDLLDSVSYGFRVGELIFAIEGAKKDGRPILRLKKIKVKNRRATAFVVDAFNNVVGLLAAIPGISITSAGTIAIQPGHEPPNLLSPKKFCIASFRPVDSDPRGSSILRPAYAPWWRKQQIIPEYLKYLAQFAGPSLIGKTAPDADIPVDDPNNVGSTLSPQDTMLAALQQFHNGTAIVVPNGASVDPIVMQGEGEAFIRALASCDQQITKAILTQELATEQSRNQARAAAQVHQDVLSTLVRMGKRHIAAMMRRQVLMNWVVMNWGEKARRLTPYVDFGEMETRDQPGLWTAAAALMNASYFSPDQLPDVDAQIGLPVRESVDTFVGEPGPLGAGAAPAQQGPPAEPAPPPAPAAPAPSSGAPRPVPERTPPPPVPPGRVAVRGHTRAKRGSRQAVGA